MSSAFRCLPACAFASFAFLLVALPGDIGAQEAPTVYAVALSVDAPLGREESRSPIARAQRAVLSRLDPGSYEVMHAYAWVPGLALKIRDPEVVKALRAMPEVAAVGRDGGGSGGLVQSGPFVGTGAAHPRGITGQGGRVAVLDTGADTDHPDLVDDLVTGVCICNTGVNCCPTGGSAGTGLPSVEDENGHGTHVTGIITSAGNVAGRGIAPDAEIVSVRMLNNNRFESTADIVASLDWVRTNAPQVVAVNMSLQTDERYPGDCDVARSDVVPPYVPEARLINLANAVEALRQAGVVSVSIAGNFGDKDRLAAPGCLSNVLSVGAVERASDTVADFTNSDPALEMWAPGVSIRSTFLNGGASFSSGTSMAAPHVTGAIALLAQVSPPSTPPERFAECVTTSRFSVTDPANGVTRPRLDLAAAIAECTLPVGQPCDLDVECAGGFCTDGVCCNTRCGGSADDCEACGVAAGAEVDGQCALFAAGTECRPAMGRCDVPDSCDGIQPACRNAFEEEDTECRPAAGVCDVAEVCTGDDGACPPDEKSTEICREAVGPCDLEEFCDGRANACPPDELEPEGEVCRSAEDECDRPEECSGTGPACPADELEDDGVACDDGACVEESACLDGRCTVIPLDCDDDDPCTADLCEEPDGCAHAPIEGCCEDDDACGAAPTCAEFACVENACVLRAIEGCGQDDDGGGCGCRATPGPRCGAPGAPVVFLVLLALFVRRRRTAP